ncbi:MAG: double zinc ribbon domain-containing protein [Coriobacteriales bacterium]|jgi:predicted amidophosphoribosyltransferase|nr:double zinc ribbon domain-containing protein [Coriobacteriales bacterium]
MRTHLWHRPSLGRHADRLRQAALELLWPTRCVGCERLGVLLCEDCASALPFIDQGRACPRCGAPAGALVCTECAPVHERTALAFTQARCALEFAGPVPRLVVAYKDGGERRLAGLLARLVARVVTPEWRCWADVLAWVPADAAALRRRGFDHMRLVAEALGALTGLRTAPLLVKQAQLDQRLLGRRQRRENAGSVFSLHPSPAIAQRGRAGTGQGPRAAGADVGKGPCAADVQGVLRGGPLSSFGRIVLIDDVLTTGATLDAATRVLLSAGAQEVRVATVARVW